MEIFDASKELININPQNTMQSYSSSNKDALLCNHCKRTASNGIRCLGMCVADNDY